MARSIGKKEMKPEVLEFLRIQTGVVSSPVPQPYLASFHTSCVHHTLPAFFTQKLLTKTNQ